MTRRADALCVRLTRHFPRALSAASLLVLSLVLCGSISCSRAQDPVLPVYEEPMHRLVLESLPVRVLDVQVPVGGTSLSHLHTDPDREFELRNSGPQPVTLVVIEVR